MSVQGFALTFGIIYTGVGILGLIPAFLAPAPAPGPDLAVTTLYGYLLGLFPVNILHTLVHLAIGVWGLAAGTKMGASIAYARSLAIIFGVLAVMGLIPGLNTVFGLIPLHGHDIWLHAGTSGLAAYFGWRGAPVTRERRGTMGDRRQRAIPVARERRVSVVDRRGAGYPRGA